MKVTSLLLASLLATALAGCGGGGSDPSPQPVPPKPPVATAPPPYTFTPAAMSASFIEGYPVTIELSAKQTVTFVGVSYIKIVPDAEVIDPAIQILSNADGSLKVQAKTLAGSKPGRYTGNITINVCVDPNCATHLQGSPTKLPYDIEVIPAAGKLTSFNLTALASLSGAEDWGTFQGNAAHTGYVPVTLAAGSFNLRWKLDTSAIKGVQRTPSSIATGGGRLYTAYGVGGHSGSNEFVAYNENDGGIVWTSKFDDEVYARTNAPAYANGKVYGVAGAQHTTAMYGYDAASGAQLFKGQMASQWETYLAPTIYSGNVFTNGGTYGGMYSFDANNGARNYFKDLGQYDGWTPAIDASGLYAYVGGSLHVINTVSGSVVATIKDPSYEWNGYTTNGAPVIASGGLVIAGNLRDAQNNALTAFDSVAKSVRWSVRGGFSGNPAYADGTVFAANNKTERLEALKESDGTVAWSWARPAGESFVSDVLVTKNLVFVSTSVATYAIDRSTRQQVWSHKASGSLALSANGILYIKGSKAITAINLR